jgi:hypothetical protein
MANGGQNKRLTAITDGKTRATGGIRNTEGTKGLSCMDIMQCREPLRGMVSDGIREVWGSNRLMAAGWVASGKGRRARRGEGKKGNMERG